MDSQLGLSLWPPAGRTRPVGLASPAGGGLALGARDNDDVGPVPSWFAGDEAESQAFLHAEGVELE